VRWSRVNKGPSSLLLSFPLLLGRAFAQNRTFTVDPQISEVSFALGSDHAVHGTFHRESGSIDFDRSCMTISGSVLVATGGGESGNEPRDRKMTTNVLDAPHFADISFAPKSYRGTIAPSGDSTIQLIGIFTLHGTPHDLTVPMQVHIDGTTCTAKTKFTVPYVKWGRKDPSVLILKVAKEVEIDPTLAGQLSAAS